MSDLARFGIIATVIQVLVLFVVIAKTNRLIKKGKSIFLPFFFILAMMSYVLSDLYWVAYDFLKPDTRMPIAANEIGECAMVLLLCAGLDSLLADKRKVAGEVLYAFLFIAANIALWIVWSGEWVQDILFGIPYIYFLWLLIRGIRTRGTMTRKELSFALVTSVLVLATLVFIRFVEGFVRSFALLACYLEMLVLIVWLGIKSFRSKDFFVATTFFLWTILSMFATPNPYYNVPFFANTVALPMMFVALKKELAADDLC